MRQKLIFLVGPTAVGKSVTALNLAKKINAEIISCDSMQVYRGMGIITSQPPSLLRRNIAHHLVGIVSPQKEYSVWQYRKEALQRIKGILKKGKVALFVGGTGLYVSILIDGIFEAGIENKAIREKLYKQVDKYGNTYLYKKLEKIDPQIALKIHPNDTRRIVRALEVYAATGKPISELQKQRKGLADEYDIKIFCLNMERDKLYQHIDGRVDKMFRQGLINEAKKLLKLKLSRTASYAIGLREIKGYFNGQYGLDEAKRLMQRNSRLYAKRQLTWFRKDKRIKWINISDKDKPEEIAQRIWKKLY